MFPQKWKIAQVIPIHKKGNKLDLSNNRSISLLPVLLKVMEKVTEGQIKNHLEDKKLLNFNQFGFRKNESCEQAFINLAAKIFAAKNSKLYTVVAALDYSKAFDTVCHAALLHKLETLGVGKITLNWFRSYLTNRHQFVGYNSALSDRVAVTSGVPRGSIYRPLLFIIYLNDLLNLIPNNCCIAYADDLTVFCSGDTATKAQLDVQKLVDLITSWSANNGLILNPSKYKVMCIPPSVKKENPSTVSLVINNITIDSSISLAILGVTISFDLNWNCHIDHVAKKVSSKTGALHRFGHSLNSCTRQRLHNTFLLPHFLYSISVWGNCSKFAEHQLDRSMKRCKRFILNCKDAELLASD